MDIDTVSADLLKEIEKLTVTKSAFSVAIALMEVNPNIKAFTVLAGAWSINII